MIKVYNSGAITTKDDSSQGIVAQSLGGGGGNGGFSFAGNITPILSASFSLGGSGNTAGDGSAVTVFNTGSIATGSITNNSDGDPDGSRKQVPRYLRPKRGRRRR